MELTIRDARPDDAEAIVGVLNPIIEARVYTAFDTPLSVESERDFIASFPSQGVFHVAIRRPDEKLVGFQNLEPFGPYTHAFDHVGTLGTFVDLECRRQGVGRQLFAATFAAATRKGYEKIFTFVRADNDGALRAYLGQGFRIVGTAERHAKVDGRYIGEIVIEKFLSSL